MRLRLCLEPKSGININDAAAIKWMAGRYFESFGASYAGYIVMDAKEKIHKRFEPVWQFLIQDASDACAAYLAEYVQKTPLAGYHVHVYRVEKGESLKLV